MSVTEPVINTFSIVGYDPATGDTGLAVATKYIAVGRRVPHAEPGVGALAVQASFSPVAGPRGLELLRQGLAPDAVIAALMSEDEARDVRQLGIVDGQGRAATYTGPACEQWAGGLLGRYCAAQGNMLVGELTVRAMIDHFVSQTGSLADRLVNALRAGELAGGDRRGRQSAAVLVVRPNVDLSLTRNRLVDLRVDADPQPCRQLRLVLDRYYHIYRETPEDAFLAPTTERVRCIQLALHRLGRYCGEFRGSLDEATRQALWGFCLAENQQGRWRADGRLDPLLLQLVEEMADGQWD